VAAVALGPGPQPGGDAALVDDENAGARGAVAGGAHVTLDPVAGEAGDLLDRWPEGPQRPQHPVAEPLPGHPGRQGRRHQPGPEELLLGAGDPDGDGLGLVADGVDGTGQLVDGPGEGGGEVLHDRAGRADPAVV